MILTRSWFLLLFAAALLGLDPVARAQTNRNNSSERTIAVTGVVHLPDGNPAANTEVRLVSAFNTTAPSLTNTDSNGKFAFDWKFHPGGLPPSAVLVARDAGRNLAAVGDVSEDVTNFDLKFAPGLTFTGSAQSGGSPLTKVHAVAALKADRMSASLKLGEDTNDGATFQLAALPAGRMYRITISAPGFGSKTVDEESDQAKTNIDLGAIDLRAATNMISGHVYNDEGKTEAGVKIHLVGYDQPTEEGTTDDQGRFEFKVCDGKVRLNANTEHDSSLVETSAGETNIAVYLGFAMNRPCKVSGIVKTPDGKPAGGAELMVFPANGNMHWTKTDSNGAFTRIWALQPWQRGAGAQLFIRDSSNNLAALAPLDPDTTNVEVKLSPALAISGIVKNTNDAALTNSSYFLMVRTANASETLNQDNGKVDGNGHFEIKGLPMEGSYTLSVFAKGYSQAQQQIAPDQETNRLELPPFILNAADRIIKGRVLDDDDKPLVAANVSISGDGQPNDHVATDKNGGFEFNVCEGQLRIFATPAGGGRSFPAAAEAGDTNIIVRFTESNMGGAKSHRLKGIVVDTEGKPVGGAQLAVLPANGPPEWKTTRADGSFALTWAIQPWLMQGGGPVVVARAAAQDLGAALPFDAERTNIEIHLKPAVSLTGFVRKADESAFPGATLSVVAKVGNHDSEIPVPTVKSDAQGRFEFKSMPADATFVVTASADGHGQSQQPIRTDNSTNRVELFPLYLKPTDSFIAGQVLDDDDKPMADVDVHIDGIDQPKTEARTDRKGRFRAAVCKGAVHLVVNDQGGYNQIAAESGDTNVVLVVGQMSMFGGGASHRVLATVTDAEGKPVPGAQAAIFPKFFSMKSHWKKTETNGAARLTWSMQPWQLQNGNLPMAVARDPARNTAGTADLHELDTNVSIKLEPAMTVFGLVKSDDGAPLAGARVAIQIKSGNSFTEMEDQPVETDAGGRYRLKCLPPGQQYNISISANSRGKSQLSIQSSVKTNSLEMRAVELKTANRVIAGRVLDEKNAPIAGATVSASGEGQPDANMLTDSKGYFHFKVCEGQVNLFANSPQGGFSQGGGEAGETNVVLQLGARRGALVRDGMADSPPESHLAGKPLPSLAETHLPEKMVAGGSPVLVCLFDAGQRASRQMMKQLNEQTLNLRDKGVVVIGVQSVITGGEIFNQWRAESPVSFPVGRVTEKTNSTKWILEAKTLPWLILTDASHKVVSDGFQVENLDQELKKLGQ